MAKVTAGMIFVTNDCNLNCKYCYEQKEQKSITKEILYKSIDFLFQNSINNQVRIIFFGGEPFLKYEEILKPGIEYIRKTYSAISNISITTNGVLLDEEKLKFLKDNRVGLMLSLDGNEKSHNANRIDKSGKGTFSIINEKIPLLLKYFPNTTARMTVTPSNAEYLYDSVIELEKLGFNFFNIMPNLFENWRAEDYNILEQQFIKIENYIIKTFESEEIPLVPIPIAQMFFKRVIKEYQKEHAYYRKYCDCDINNRCGIGTNGKVVIDIYGNIYSCPHCSMEPKEEEPLYIGNLETGISDKKIEILKSLNKHVISQDFNCKECELDEVCAGGCVPNNLLINKNFNIAPKIYCIWSKLNYNSSKNIINYFDKKQDNELFKDYFYGMVVKGVYSAC